MKTNTDTLYHQDFYSWIYHNIELLRQSKFAEIDVETLIEELESMAKGNKRELRSHLVILIAHLLKWQFHSDHRSRSWHGSIVEQRYQIVDQLDESPSLKPHLAEAIKQAYPGAVKIAVKETGLPKTTFPESCPYYVEQLLDEDFYPDVH
jgi:hypothetical protein